MKCINNLDADIPSINDGYLELQSPSELFKATVYRTCLNGRYVVVKDYINSRPIFRATICRMLLHREIKAIKRLQDIPGTPNFVDNCGKYGFIMEWVDGRELTQPMLKSHPQLLKQLEERVLDLHSSGVTHNDIRMKNILVDSTGILYLIDFASAMLRLNRSCFLPNIIYKFFRFNDRVKVVRFKQKFSPEQLSAIDLRLSRYTKLFKSFSRCWKKYCYSWFKNKKH